jgi:hypothetical protein
VVSRSRTKQKPHLSELMRNGVLFVVYHAVSTTKGYGFISRGTGRVRNLGIKSKKEIKAELLFQLIADS